MLEEDERIKNLESVILVYCNIASAYLIQNNTRNVSLFILIINYLLKGDFIFQKCFEKAELNGEYG